MRSAVAVGLVAAGVAALPCGAEAAIEFARWTEVAALDSMTFAKGVPWSPRLPLLALESADGSLFVFDAATPEAKPVRALPAAAARWVGWSPDGTWLLVIAERPQARGLQTLIACPAKGGPSHKLAETKSIRWAHWDRHGLVHYGPGGAGTVRAPSAWRPAAPPESLETPGLVVAREDGALLTGWLARDPVTDTQRMRFEPLELPGTTTQVVDEAAGVDRWLIRVLEPDTTGAMRPRDLVIDHRGRVIADSVAREMTATTISADGVLLAGFRTTATGDTLRDAQLFLESVFRRGLMPVMDAPAGSDPRFSRAGKLIAFRGLRSGALYVGRLRFFGR